MVIFRVAPEGEPIRSGVAGVAVVRDEQVLRVKERLALELPFRRSAVVAPQRTASNR
jgi:hypothetical protein